MGKRKRSSVATAVPVKNTRVALPVSAAAATEAHTVRQPKPARVVANPNSNPNIIDGQEALRASPDSDSPLSETAEDVPGCGPATQDGPSSKAKRGSARKPAKATTAKAASPSETVDPEADELEGEAVEDIQAAALRPPAVNSEYLPLPWKGRLGYACLCTYLRYANQPVFSSRTCRIASIIEQRHPLKDPNMPHHPTKNRPDKDQPADIARGQAYVEGLGLANARDIPKMLRWNERFGIRFFRLSSEMFPFASHEVYGYKLKDFASEALAEAGRVAAKYGHRLTTHPGQFTQLGSPRKEVIAASIRDLAYHAELLSLLKLPPQQDRDAVMILHMGGVFGDKAATLDRFRKNYLALPDGVKKRLVLENDDVSWSVHELLPICKELNIPLVLDYHHNNIIHSDKIREGTLDIMALYDEIRETWTRKGVTQKMHYSEPTPPAVTGRQRRKHNPRVATLPPCRPDMDLMIEAKDKEQAVFELMRAFKLPGFDRFNDIIPHVRIDENRPEKKKATPRRKPTAIKTENGDDDVANDGDEAAVIAPRAPVPDDEIGMGGPDGRVYWPPGMEEWLRPVKRIVKKKEPAEREANESTPVAKKRKTAVKKEENVGEDAAVPMNGTMSVKKAKTRSPVKKARNTRAVASSDEGEQELPDLSEVDSPPTPTRKAKAVRQARRGSSRAKRVNYEEQD